MASNKLNVGMLANVASDGNEGVSNQHVLTYVAANNSVEFKELNLSISGTGTVSSNADSINTSTVSDINTVQDNVATTLTSLSTANTSIDTIEANLAAFATYANTNYASDAANSFATITVGEANVVASGTSNTLVFTSGNGISVTADAASQAITFDVNIGNVASEYYVLDGTANTVTLTKDNRPANTLYVTVGGLVQEPGINYITASTTLTLINTYPIINGTDVEVRYLPYTGEIFTAPPPTPSQAQGETAGYTAGGRAWPATTQYNTIDKFPFASDTNASDVNDLSAISKGASGSSSSTHGYSTQTAGIEKFSMVSDSAGTNIGNMFLTRNNGTGQSSTTHGYTSVGESNANGNTIEKHSFSSDSDATDVGESVATRWGATGISSVTHGYISCGIQPSLGSFDLLDKFSFSSDGSSTDVGEATTTRFYLSSTGMNSASFGYSPGGSKTNVDKFPFANESSATAVGTLAFARYYGAGQSSLTNGYNTGGYTNSEARNEIDKFSFATDGNATDVGDLTVARGEMSGHQI